VALLPNQPRASSGSRVALSALVRAPAARSAFAVMATAQVVMAGVMTATPLNLHLHHQTLGQVGLVVSAHTLGMFALSPLTGWLLDRVGAGPVMVAGLVTLVLASVLAAVVPGGGWQAGALFLLGFGWNLCFVGGSGRLAGRLSTSDQAAVEGAVDAAVWGAAAVASLASTAVLSATGYAVLALLSGALVAIPATVLARPAPRALTSTKV
jgi:MFS family permease